MDNKLIIAAAGSGKTTALIKEALQVDSNVLITTFTESNAEEIKNKFVKRNGCIPENITIQTWFSFLIEHGIKPFQSFLFDERLNGMLLVSQQSGLRFKNKKGFPVYFGEENFYKHYFTNDMRVYSDKLSKLVIKLNTASQGKVIDRLSKVYPTIFIDESQDLAGYDLDIIKLLGRHLSCLRLVCDPRQVTYLTHHERKYKKYREGKIEDFINVECKKLNFEIDSTSLGHSFRCNQSICDLANQLYPEVKECNSKQAITTSHDGVFLVNSDSHISYLKKFQPTQLRWNVLNKLVDSDYAAYNFGQSKGLTFDRVLIYPTKKMVEWLIDPNAQLPNETRAKLYVAITRAKHSVGILVDASICPGVKGTFNFKE